MGCKKGMCGCPNSVKVSKEDEQLTLEQELAKTKADLKKAREQLAEATAQKNMLGVNGFKACAEVSFMPNSEK